MCFPLLSWKRHKNVSLDFSSPAVQNIMDKRIAIIDLVTSNSDPVVVTQAMDEILGRRSQRKYQKEEIDFVCYHYSFGLGWEGIRDLYNMTFPEQNRSKDAVQSIFYRKDLVVRAKISRAQKVRRRIAGNNSKAPLAPKFNWQTFELLTPYYWKKGSFETRDEFRTRTMLRAKLYRASVDLEKKRLLNQETKAIFCQDNKKMKAKL